MTQPESPTPDYALSYGDAFARLQPLHNARTNAAYLLPMLRPGLRLLDFGCGSGDISVGLAEAVAPGELHGVDPEEAQIELARSLAVSTETGNATFHVGEVTALPFPDGFFDVAHCHTVLMYVPDTQAALAEVKRVLKPGGLIACREMICESSFVHPDLGIMQTAWNALEDLLYFDEGHPQMGKEMKAHILEAGFTNIRVSASFDTHSAPAEVALIHSLARRWFSSPEMLGAASAYDMPGMTQSLFERLSAAIDEWKDLPDAAVAYAYGEAVANKP